MRVEQEIRVGLHTIENPGTLLLRSIWYHLLLIPRVNLGTVKVDLQLFSVFFCHSQTLAFQLVVRKGQKGQKLDWTLNHIKCKGYVHSVICFLKDIRTLHWLCSPVESSRLTVQIACLQTALLKKELLASFTSLKPAFYWAYMHLVDGHSALQPQLSFRQTRIFQFRYLK